MDHYRFITGDEDEEKTFNSEGPPSLHFHTYLLRFRRYIIAVDAYISNTEKIKKKVAI